MAERERHPATWAAQGGGEVFPPYGEIVPPLHLSTTYERAPDNTYPLGPGYSRDQNPTYHDAERVLAALEGGEEAALFASGMAAATAVFLPLMPGDHVIVPTVMYWALRKWVTEYLPPRGIEVSLFDNRRGDQLDEIARLIRPGRTRLLWLESPANPLWCVTDIEAAAALAHRHEVRVAIDSTAATPVLTQPLRLGADIVMHSATKGLNGHSDVIAGALVTARRDEAWSRIRAVRGSQGAVLGPFEAWLLRRGMRTLFVRMAAQSRAAIAIAEGLAREAGVEEVLYPGLPSHAGHAIAARQMTGGFGSMLSVRVAGGAAGAIAAAARLRVWKRATSLGGVESLVEHRASVEGPDTPCPPDLLRLSVGLEDPADLLDDFRQALG